MSEKENDAPKGESLTAKEAKANAKAAQAQAKALRPFYKKPVVIILAAIAAIVVINLASGGDSGSGDSPAASETSSSTPEEAAIVVTAQKMIEDLESNALAASTTYEDKRVTVTGKVGNIDASGDYFSIQGTDEYSFTNVQIFINDEQVATVSGYTAGQEVTVTGTVTEVGEILGYSIDAESLS